jgi:hypothetical protein
MTGETSDPEPEEKAAPKHETKAAAEPKAAAAVSEAAAAAGNSDGTPDGTWRLRRPTIVEMAAFVAVVGGIVGLVFAFAPGCQPQPPPSAIKATISDVDALRPVTFKRFLQRLHQPIPPEMTPQFLARRGVMVEFHYEIIGLGGKQLLLAWELSDAKTHDLVAAEQSAYELEPSKNDDSGDWPIWIPAPKPGRNYYAIVTIYKPEGPPYELTHFRTKSFPGFASR